MKKINPFLGKLIVLTAFVSLFPLAAAAEPVDPGENVREAFNRAGLPLLREKIPVADFSLKLVDGRTVTLGAFKGRVVFLNF